MTSILTINLGALKANYKRLQERAPGVITGACVKANGYGLGANHVARTLEGAGCQHFFVAHVEEGIKLRASTTQNIYVFGGLHTGDVAAFANHRLIPVLNSLADIEAWTGGPCAIHFDTGMNRLGLGADETARLLDAPHLLAKHDVRLFMSHFACSEDAAHPMNLAQCERITQLKNTFGPLYPKALWSMCNSGGIFHYSQVHFDLVRPGLALYGGNPTPETNNPMLPVVSLDARVLQIRNVLKDDTIGYSATHHFEANTQTATINLGYADGFFRTHSSRAHVYCQGTPCPVLGRVSMDLVTIGIGHLQDQKPGVGDMVEVLGPHQDVEALAASANTISYEILTSLGLRYTRRYIDAS